MTTDQSNENISFISNVLSVLRLCLDKIGNTTLPKLYVKHTLSVFINFIFNYVILE